MNSKTPPLVNGVGPKLDTENQSDFDPIRALTWKDGIGTLPGSNLKFKLNEFRALEVVTECLDIDMAAVSKDVTGTNNADQAQSGVTSRNAIKENFSKMKEMYQTDYNTEDMEQNGSEDSKSDVSYELARCENCDCFGLKVEFCKAGRFCSQVCVAAFAHKKNLWLKKGAKDSKKKRKRKASDIEDEDAAHKTNKVDDEEPESVNKDTKNKEIKKETNDSIEEIKPKLVEFCWNEYLKKEKTIFAPLKLFHDSSPNHGFKIGMKLEAVDKKNSSLVCVSTVADVMDNRFLIHFDGWEDIYDYWTEPNSPSIHPINWCQENGHDLTPPKEFKSDRFCWAKYLTQTKSIPVPTQAFKSCSSLESNVYTC